MGVKRYFGLFVVLAVVAGASLYGSAAKAKDWGKYQSGELRSGYTYASKETRAMQDDGFAKSSSCMARVSLLAYV